MASETEIQQFIHKLEEGGWVKWVWLCVLAGAVSYVCYAWMFKENGFKGLNHPHAFEQAEIARELARGHGFSTRMIRPAELWLFRNHARSFPIQQIPDTYHAPLWPVVLAPFVSITRKSWVMTVRDVEYPTDKAIAYAGLLFFLLAVAVTFFIAARLFDQRLAWLGAGLMLVCDRFWRFSMSGLPQMLMLFLFSLAVYALVRIVEIHDVEQLLAEEDEANRHAEPEGETPAAEEPAVLAVSEAVVEKPGPEESGESEEIEAQEVEAPGPYSLVLWSAAAGAAFGLLALAHAMTLWLFGGALIFAAVGVGRDRWRVLLPMFVAASLLYAPWLVRNYQVCGSPAGVSWYSGLSSVRGTEGAIMRSREVPINGASPTMFFRKVEGGVLNQLGSLPSMLGFMMLAPVFFVALFHPFKRRSTARFRWCALLMWVAGVLGMAVFGLDEGGLKSNDLQVLFIPVFTFYGLAFVLVLWSRLEIRVRLVRIGFLVFLYLICGAPFVLTFLDLHLAAGIRVEWPPYVPPYIAILNSWTNDQEIIMSDMPWAVAWYADRRSLWLPTTIKEYVEMSDYNLLQGHIVGLYLTPVSGDQPFLGGIVQGDYKDWAPCITRSSLPRNFPLPAVTVLPLMNECIFYADRDRWSVHED